MCDLSRVQIIKRLKFNRLRGSGRQPRSVREDPPTALRRLKRKPTSKIAEYAGHARRCAVKSPMCDDEPTRSIGFGITLWPTAFLCSTFVEDYSTKLRRNLDFAAILCSGDGDGR